MSKPSIYRICPWWFAGLVLMGIWLRSVAATNTAWFARAWQTEDGLPEHTIVGLEQTPDGFLWVATHRALARFDGLRFEEFAPATPSESAADQIRAMLLDRRGRLWLAKDGGDVSCLESGKLTQILTLAEATRGALVRAMAEDAQDGIWIGDIGGTVYRIQEGKARTFGREEGLVGTGMCWLAADLRGRLWFSQAGSAGVFQDGRFVTHYTLGQQSARIAPARRGGVWLGSGLKVFRLPEAGEPELVVELKLDSAQTDVVLTALYEDRAGGLWIGTSSAGLFRFDSQGLKSVGTSHPNIINVTEDSEGNIWVGTRGGGLNRLSPRAVQLVGPASGLPFVAVQSACADAEGNLWAVGQNGVLACQSRGAWSLVSSNSEWLGGFATCVAEQPAGGVLIGTRENGVFRHRQGAFAVLEWNSQLPNLAIRSMYACGNEDLWVAINSGVARVRSHDGRVTHFPLPAGSSDVRAMTQDASGDVWMGTTSDGLLFRAHGDALLNETTNVMAQPRHIRCLQVTDDGSLWIGYAGQGLGRFKNGRYFQFRSSHGLWDEYISHLLPDDRGRLWMAGNRGLFQVARSELDGVAEGRSARVRSVVFGRGEGVPNLQATFGICPAAARTRDGRLLLPMLSGLAIVEPDVLRKHPPPPPVVIERVTVNGWVAAAYDASSLSDVSDGNPPANLHSLPTALHLGPGVRELEFEFTALSLAAPENVVFRYQLEGLDQNWVEAGSVRVARYPKVPSGNYHFRVTACNRGGIWNQTGAEVALTVTPHLWEAIWFRVIAPIGGAGLLGGGIWVTVRRRYRRRLERLEQQQALERERARIAQDLHDDLGAGLVEINFGSELAQDSGLSAEEVREHTREIGARAKEMVTALDEIVWAVNPKHDSVSSLATYFCQFAQHFLKATPVRCHLDVARDLPVAPLNSEQRHSLFLAFKEALSNVVQHAGATDLQLAIAASDDTLTISISDNGRGLTADAPRQREGADGLDNMRRRLRQLGGRCELASGPEKGTTVTFQVPLARTGRPSRA